MKNIVIVGAGPIGLYLANRLMQIINEYGLTTKITVIDPRLEECDRPGIVARNALELIGQHMNLDLGSMREGDDSGTSMFIQDLEKSLFMIAKSMDTKLIRKAFKEPHQDKIIVSEKNRPDTELSCDFIIDCSGARRVVVSKINDTHSDQKPFSVERVGNNPIKNHFIAYVTTDLENEKKIAEKKEKDPLKYALALEELRNRFGWPYFLEPELTLRKQTIKDGQGTKIRFYFYFEIPPSLEKADMETQTEWLRTLLKLKTENEDIQFTIEQGKMKFSPFVVDPDRIKEAVFPGDKNTPFTVVCGDAQIQPDYRVGIGIWSGISRANCLIDALEIHDQELDLNIGKYKHHVSITVGKHESELYEDYLLKTSRIESALETEEKRYIQAYEKAQHEGISEKEIIKKGLEEIRFQMAMIFFKKAQSAYKASIIKNEIVLDKRNEIVHRDQLDQCKKMFIQAIEKIPSTREAEKENMTENFLQLIKSYKSLGMTLQKNHKYAEAKNAYQEALSLYQKYFPNIHLEEEVKILSNLIVIANKRDSFNEAIDYANKALQIIQSNKTLNLEEMAIKIKFNLCMAMCDKILHQHEKKKMNKEILGSDYIKLTNLLTEIMDKISSKEIEPLMKKHDFITSKISLQPHNRSL